MAGQCRFTREREPRRLCSHGLQPWQNSSPSRIPAKLLSNTDVLSTPQTNETESPGMKPKNLQWKISLGNSDAQATLKGSDVTQHQEPPNMIKQEAYGITDDISCQRCLTQIQSRANNLTNSVVGILQQKCINGLDFSKRSQHHSNFFLM